MNKLLTIISLSFYLMGSITQVVAQDADAYSEYSYLWEDSGKKKKKKGNTSVVKTDSIPQKNAEPVDSLKQEEPDQQQLQSANDVSSPAVMDTIPKPEPIPVDSVPQVKEEIVEETETPEKEEKVKKEKKERPVDDGPPASDFRGGAGAMGGSKSSMNGGFTYARIGNENFVGLTLSPELKIWKIGLGLNVPILFNLDDYSFRSEIFKDGVGFARLITYVRYGVQKRDPVYVKVGELNGTMIGFGGLVNNYTNSTSFEKRKLGLHYDMNFKGLVGLEGMYSDFDPVSTNMLVFRPYVRPLSFTGIPIVKSLEIGATFLSDKDQTRRPISDSTYSTYSFTQNGINAFGLDAGLTLLRIPFIQIDAFVNYSTLNLSKGGINDSINNLPVGDPIVPIKNGSGFSYGVNFRFNFIANVFSTDMRIERLNYTDNFVPQFFDASYELNKDAKIWSLANAGAKSGIYGSLTGQILEKVIIGGSLLLPDDLSSEGAAVVQVNANLDRLMDKYSMQASYIKGNLSNLSDAFKLDERSIAKVRLIYHMNKFLATGLDYYWAFTPTGDGSYKATQYVSPYFGLNIQF